MNVTTLGIDIAKNVFQLHGVDVSGQTVMKRRINRNKLAEIMVQLPPCLIGMEACCGASLMQPNGIYRQRTPAMSAKLTDHVWTLRE